jgi:GR25 family glycosyltransferase involved in LPS biosynthesis
MKLFERFDKVYCVNLDKRSDRLLNFNQLVETYDLGNYVRVSAVDGSTINNSTKLSNGELGLIMSNLNIINEAISERLDKILIIEDDCFFTSEINNVDTYFNLLPNDWDMLYMGGNHNTHIGVNPPIKINDKVVKLHTTYSTHFVGIKSTVFEHIKIILESKKYPIDVAYTQLQKIFNVYSFTPAIAKQIKDYSDIQNKITDYDWLIK